MYQNKEIWLYNPIYLFVKDVNSWMRRTDDFHEKGVTTKSNDSTLDCITDISLYKIVLLRNLYGKIVFGRKENKHI